MSGMDGKSRTYTGYAIALILDAVCRVVHILDDMEGFTVTSKDGHIIRFQFYWVEAPVTCAAFSKMLPFTRIFMHARLSGREIWTPDAPELDIIQENASVFTQPGEVVLGPSRPLRAKTNRAMGIYYGEGQGLDACNIFAKVFDGDLPILNALGEEIWKLGMRELAFAAFEF